MKYLADAPDFEFWYDYVYLALAAGLKWAVLLHVAESAADGAQRSDR